MRSTELASASEPTRTEPLRPVQPAATHGSRLRSAVAEWTVLSAIFALPYFYLISKIPTRLYDRDSWGILVFAKTHPVIDGFHLLAGAFYRPLGNFLLVATYRVLGNAFLIHQLWMLVLFVAVVVVSALFVLQLTRDRQVALLLVVCAFLLPVWLINLRVTSNVQNNYTILTTLGVLFAIREYLRSADRRYLVLACAGWAAALLIYEAIVAFPLFFSAFVWYFTRDARRTARVTAPFWILSAAWVCLNLITGNPKLDTPVAPTNRISFVPPGPRDLFRFFVDKVVGRVGYYYGGWASNNALGFVASFVVVSAACFFLWRRFARRSGREASDAGTARISRRAVFVGGAIWTLCGIAPFLAYRPITMPVYTTLLPFLGIAAMGAAALRHVQVRFPRWGSLPGPTVALVAVAISAYQARLLLNDVRYWEPYTSSLLRDFGDQVGTGRTIALIGTAPKWLDLYNFDQDIAAGLLQVRPPRAAKEIVNVVVYWSPAILARDESAGTNACTSVFEWNGTRFLQRTAPSSLNCP